MRNKWGLSFAIVLGVVAIFCFSVLSESSAWARAGGGGSSGSRGSRSFSTPSMPSRPSPSSPSSPGYGSTPGYQGQPSSGMFGRSPFMQGMAGGLAGGFLGSLLFGNRGYASPMGGTGGGGIGLMDLIIIGLLIYFGLKLYRKRRDLGAATGSYREETLPRMDGGYDTPPYYGGGGQDAGAASGFGELERGFQQIRQFDPTFNPESFKETAEDLFFRIQAGWMNRSLEGIESMVTPEMADYFRSEFDRMKKKGIINRLENIAVRRVEPSEAWQETGKDYITVLLTANLLDYTVDEKTDHVVEGDRLNPVKFREFWTFCRDIGRGGWQLSAINQA